MLLALDTSTRYAAVALFNEERVVASQTWHSLYNHTSELMQSIVNILARVGVTSFQLECVAVALGPGGFSALRVGVSAAKGLALVSKKPIIGVGTLDMEAYPYLNSGVQVCALLEAGRDECATALFDSDGIRVREDRVCTVEQLLIEVRQTGDFSTLFCGEGVISWRDQITKTFGIKAHVVRSTPAARVWALAEIAQKRFAKGEIDDLADLQPEYLRMPSIGVPKQRGRVPQRGRTMRGKQSRDA